MPAGGKAGVFMELVIELVVILCLFPVIAEGIATITGDSSNYSTGTVALAGLIDLILMAGVIFHAWKRAT